MYLFKQIKVAKDAIWIGRPKNEDLDSLFQQGYQKILDIMPSALKDKGLARRARGAGMGYHHIPVEACDQDSCHIEAEWVPRFFRFMKRSCQGPIIINTDDETLGVSLLVLANYFLEGKPYQEVIRSVEEMGILLKGRRDIKRFLRDFYKKYPNKQLQ
ncbi:MAG: hypothetical protein HY879_26200 [Deltaproteobacteria bacterium]|nr:hypothetical protein [Deltaproteobacteria bacterium]